MRNAKETFDHNYIEVNGTSYKKGTPEEVISWLETSRERKQHIRIFYGDEITGKDWKEEHDVIGYVGRSTGSIKVPLLIHSKRSIGGSAILTNNIVKITTKDSSGKIRIVYSHPNYHLCEKSIGLEHEVEKDDSNVYPYYGYSVIIDDKVHACFETKKYAENYIFFLKGERNR